LNPQSGQPAADHLKAALNHSAHAISANKGPVVHAYEELMTLARERGKKFLCESTVMDGVPIFSMFHCGLPAAELRGFSGVLNSTSNVVLTEVEKGLSFDEAIRARRHWASRNRSFERSGWLGLRGESGCPGDYLDGIAGKLEQVRRTGIRELSEEKIRSVRAAGMRYKLVCRAERRGAGVDCQVRPELLLAGDPLANLEGTSSAIHFDLDVFGLSLVEHNPGIDATAYGLLADFLRAVRRQFNFRWCGNSWHTPESPATHRNAHRGPSFGHQPQGTIPAHTCNA
jgi:homoserine dehydrogenase